MARLFARCPDGSLVSRRRWQRDVSDVGVDEDAGQDAQSRTPHLRTSGSGTGASVKRPKGLRLPRRCECGGKMVYAFEFGRVFSHCASCTPVVVVKIPRTTHATDKKGT